LFEVKKHVFLPIRLVVHVNTLPIVESRDEGNVSVFCHDEVTYIGLHIEQKGSEEEFQFDLFFLLHVPFKDRKCPNFL